MIGARGVLEQIAAFGDEPGANSGDKTLSVMTSRIGLRHTTYDFVENAHVVRGGV